MLAEHTAQPVRRRFYEQSRIHTALAPFRLNDQSFLMESPLLNRVVDDDGLMLVLPIRIYHVGGAKHIEKQAHNGLRLWLKHFKSVTLCLAADDIAVPPVDTLPLDELDDIERLRVVMLPLSFTPHGFLRRLPNVASILREEIDRATYLQFAIGGLWGDWAAVACFVAHRRNRKFAVWTDRVESQVVRYAVRSRSGVRALYWQINAWLMHYYERAAIRRASIGLFHGMDCFKAYSACCSKPHLVHDIHVGPEARIDTAALLAKQARTTDVPLTIIYAGRVHPEKGVSEWIETLALLDRAGVDFRANWYGEGPALAAAQRDVAARNLESKIAFSGNLADRDILLATIRDADIFLFCHKTPESPRCLIESLISGTPIIGFFSAYPEDLIAAHGGGILTEHDPAKLANAVIALRRSDLSRLMRAAASDGYDMIDESVFAHRSHLIKAHAARTVG